MYGKPTPTVTVNGRSYRAPERPVVVVCVDGSEPSMQTTTVGAFGNRYERPLQVTLAPARL